MFKEKNVIELNLPLIPENETTFSYKLTISKVTRTKKAETDELYFNKKTGERIDWSKWYGLTDEEKKGYKKHNVFTGGFTVGSNDVEVYQQEKDYIDVGELAIFLNRAN